jgi:hypothetical protein
MTSRTAAACPSGVLSDLSAGYRCTYRTYVKDDRPALRVLRAI